MPENEISTGPLVAEVVCPHCGQPTAVNVPGWVDKTPRNRSITPCSISGCKKSIRVARNAPNDWSVEQYVGGGSGCFAATTLISTPFGRCEIQDLNRGDTVWSLDPVAQKLVPRMVLARPCYRPTSLIRLTVEQAGVCRSIKVTRSHVFLTHTGWMPAARVKKGSGLVCASNNGKVGAAVVADVDSIRAEPVFNLHTAMEHNFIAEGVVVHNFAWFRRLRTAYHRLFVDPFTSQPNSIETDSVAQTSDKRVRFG